MDLPTRFQDECFNFVLLEKQGKRPFQKAWTTKIIKYNDVELIDHLKNGGNYGVIGGANNLLIVDFDSEKLQTEVISKLPDTFKVKTGSGLLHLYFKSNAALSFKILNPELDTLADIQGEGRQVVGPGSIHPNGNEYTIVDDKEIAFIDYAELKAILMPYDKSYDLIVENKTENKTEYNNNFIDEIRTKIKIEDLLAEFGVDISQNPSNCLFHSSKGGKCLGWNKDVAHCFHCDDSWNIFTLVQQYKKLTFFEALQWLADRENMSDELKATQDKWKKDKDLKDNPFKIFSDPNAQAALFNDLQPYFYDRSGLWWLWEAKEYKWKVVDEIDMLNMIGDSTDTDIISPKNRTIILNTMKQEGRKNIPIPAEKTWIQFNDTILDVKDGSEFTATPKYFVTNPIPWNLDKTKNETPIMDKIFKEWVGEDSVKTLYEIIAYCLLPDYPIHRIFCFIGGGLNGKSKYLELLHKFIGFTNVCSTELDTLLSSRFEITRLHKKLVCQMGETNFNEMKRTSILKKLTGGDLMGFEYKNKNPFEERNYAKILIATNNLPTTSDKTVGFYRRWMIIDFPNQFTEAKDILKDIPDSEYEALAFKSANILKELLVKRKFHNEGTIEARTKRYEDKSNPLEKFFKENVVEDITGQIWKWEFEEQLNIWCKENNFRELSANVIGKKMKELAVTQQQIARDNGKTWRAWIGIKFKNSLNKDGIFE